MTSLYYSIDITQRSINGTIFRGYIVVDSTTDVITTFYKDLDFGVNILASGTNILNADNTFLINNFSYNGTTITTFPFLANTYQGTAWNLYYDTPTQRIAYRNYLGEWIDLPDDYNFTFISVPKLPVVIQPIPFCAQNNKLTCMKTTFTQKGNKRFDSDGLVTQISKAMRYSQVQRMPKNSICIAQPAIKPPVVENTVSQFKSLTLIYTLTTYFSFPDNGGSQIPGEHIACSYNGQYVTIVCNSDIPSNNICGIYVSSNYGVTFQPILPANVSYSTTDTFFMHSVSVSYTGQYQFAVTNGRSSSSIGVYYSDTYGSTWNRFLYNNTISVSNLRWSQCTCISPSGQYMFAGGGGSGDGYGTGSGTGPGTGIGGWYDYYSNDYGATWQVAGNISDRISCTMNPNTFDVISVVNFNSAYNSFPGLFLKTNQTKLPINETTINPPDTNSRPFKITSDDNSNVFMIAVNNVNHQLNNGLLDPNQDFLNPTPPMYGYYSSDSGSTYGSAIILPGAFLHIAYNSSGTRLWACSNSTVYYSKNNGTSWYTLTTNIIDIYGMALSRDGQHLYLMEEASTNKIYRANVSAF
jgi:hypothetical protein